MEKTVNIFGAHMSSSVHIDNKSKDILIPAEEHTQGLDGTTLAAQAKFLLILHTQEKDLY